jgi:hypothetical protein
MSPNNKQGFVALITIIFMAAGLALLIVPAFSEIGSAQIQLIRSIERKKAFYRAISCKEIAKLRSMNNPSYSGNELIQLSTDESCTIAKI